MTGASTIAKHFSFSPLIGEISVDSGLGLYFDKPLAQARAALVRHVDNPALAPSHFGPEIQLDATTSTQLVTTVPAGKRLVIKDVSYRSSEQAGTQTTDLYLNTTNPLETKFWISVNPPHVFAVPGQCLRAPGTCT